MLREVPQKRTGVSSSRLWMLPLLGLCVASFILRCDARAVNVSNTWTMPQEGLNVFYRFFRDRISWFEADAVCQFHHANLVTVDNSFQFDATRDLLRELDVNDIVWIGLMRPQNSDRFMWSNSRPLVVDTGYWAESLPLMDAPLCAVIDPIRDYRWHALRCGGPETASFLCEMPVPSWADACILKEMPNLTMQYMADTASIELIRNCQEEGLLRHTCRGKEDRERAIRELICPKERLEAQRINDITNSHFKSLQIINNIRTDNNENNDIELLPLVPNYGASAPKIEVATSAPAPVERFSLDKLMMADAPVSLSRYHILPDEVPMPVKKSAKKVNIHDEYAKKLLAQHKTQQEQQHEQQEQQEQLKRKVTAKPVSHLDMMMGDQPALSDEQLPEDVSDADVSNEIFEPLPHKKKILPQDLRTMSPIPEEVATTTTAAATPATTTVASSTHAPATTTTKATAPITTATTRATTEIHIVRATATAATATTTTATREAAATAAETEVETVADTTVVAATSKPFNSYTSNNKNNNNNYNPAPAPTTAAISPAASTVSIAHPIHPGQQQSRDEMPHPHIKETADNSHFIPPMLLVKSHYVPPTKHAEHAEHGEHIEHGEHKLQHVAKITTVATTATATTPAAATATATTSAQVNEETYTSSRLNVAAVAAVTTATVPDTTVTARKPSETPTPTTTASTTAASAGTTKETTTTTTAAETATKMLTTEAAHLLATTTTKQPTTSNENSLNATTTTATAATATATATATAATANAEMKGDAKLRLISESGRGEETQLEEQDDDEIDATGATTRRNFLQAETEAPFKPNRRRSLTKPETVSYFKKILG
ncbi:uncharacterized protein LOC117787618 [Drosophila innubila]|uniref:uncharacterized protein LOC117787618 n=1 Tax=Drosophila innubila TaxID=198719 RepID=UPI00148D65AF|nr:uncharacterized protein LOC117787618 [Drosophila innubila]